MKSLFIGRFQPFHKGHQLIIKKIKNNFEKINIGIGSSQYHHTITNPFTSDERKLMIKKSLEEIDVKNYKIYLIPDVHNFSIWVEYVTSIVSDFDVVITNNLFTKNLFIEKSYKIQGTTLYKIEKYSGKEIRSRIINDRPWKNLVPKSVYNIINDINGIKRLKNLSSN